MATLSRLAQQIHSTPRHDFATVANKRLEYFLEVQNLWLAINEGNHIDTKYGLHAGLCIQIIEHNIADFTTTQLYHHPHTILIGFIA